MKPIDIDKTAWDAALERLLDDVYTFALTGPRRHEDWARDALAVMDRSVTDPRGRRMQEWQIDAEGRENIRPSFPFLPPTSSDAARSSASPDFLGSDLAGGRAFTDYMMDVGLIAVSPEEVGVFWTFNAN